MKANGEKRCEVYCTIAFFIWTAIFGAIGGAVYLWIAG
jgi:hypothetical protein